MKEIIMCSSGKRMMGYLPDYWHNSLEMQQILHNEGLEVDTLNKKVQCIFFDAFIMTASLERIEEWEKWLKLPPVGTLDERRRRILGYFQTFVKLNEGVIKTIVAALYNNARANVSFADSEIKIEVIPLPENDKDVDFPLLYTQLEPKKPCHIGIAVKRFYCTWGDIKNGFKSWGDVKTKRKTWLDVKNFIPR